MAISRRLHSLLPISYLLILLLECLPNNRSLNSHWILKLFCKRGMKVMNTQAYTDFLQSMILIFNSVPEDNNFLLTIKLTYFIEVTQDNFYAITLSIKLVFHFLHYIKKIKSCIYREVFRKAMKFTPRHLLCSNYSS